MKLHIHLEKTFIQIKGHCINGKKEYNDIQSFFNIYLLGFSDQELTWQKLSFKLFRVNLSFLYFFVFFSIVNGIAFIALLTSIFHWKDLYENDIDSGSPLRCGSDPLLCLKSVYEVNGKNRVNSPLMDKRTWNTSSRSIGGYIKIV